MCAICQCIEDHKHSHLLSDLIDRTGGINNEGIGHRLKHFPVSHPLAARLLTRDFRLPLLQDLGGNIEQNVKIWCRE